MSFLVAHAMRMLHSEHDRPLPWNMSRLRVDLPCGLSNRTGLPATGKCLRTLLLCSLRPSCSHDERLYSNGLQHTSPQASY